MLVLILKSLYHSFMSMSECLQKSDFLTYFGIWHQKPDNNALTCTHKHHTDDEFYFLFATVCLISLQSNARKKTSWENSDSKQAEYLI